MSAICSKCDSPLFGTSDGGWECPVCDWLPAFTACHALGIKPADLKAQVRALVRALKRELPMTPQGGCLYCQQGSVPDNFIHGDTDNLWRGDQCCLHHPNYRLALIALARFKGVPHE